MLVLQDFEEYYHIKYGKIPKLVSSVKKKNVVSACNGNGNDKETHDASNYTSVAFKKWKKCLKLANISITNYDYDSCKTEKFASNYTHPRNYQRVRFDCHWK